MKNMLLLSAFLLSMPVLAQAETTYSSSRSGEDGDTINSSSELDATQAIEAGYGLSPEDFGVTDPSGLGLSEEEIEAVKKLRAGESEPGFTQKENNPNNQVYKGASSKNKKFESKRTHRMYEDTRY